MIAKDIINDSQHVFRCKEKTMHLWDWCEVNETTNDTSLFEERVGERLFTSVNLSHFVAAAGGGGGGAAAAAAPLGGGAHSFRVGEECGW